MSNSWISFAFKLCNMFSPIYFTFLDIGIWRQTSAMSGCKVPSHLYYLLIYLFIPSPVDENVVSYQIFVDGENWRRCFPRN